jgi:hypothetical protein
MSKTMEAIRPPILGPEQIAQLYHGALDALRRSEDARHHLQQHWEELLRAGCERRLNDLRVDCANRLKAQRLMFEDQLEARAHEYEELSARHNRLLTRLDRQSDSKRKEKQWRRIFWETLSRMFQASSVV